MILTLPTRTDLTHYEFSHVLDGVTFVLAFRWNLREEAWMLDISLEDGTQVASGVKVVVEWALLRELKTENRPLGEFIAFDTSGARRNPAIDDLGSRVKLYYFDAATVAEIASAA